MVVKRLIALAYLQFIAQVKLFIIKLVKLVLNFAINNYCLIILIPVVIKLFIKLVIPEALMVKLLKVVEGEFPLVIFEYFILLLMEKSYLLLILELHFLVLTRLLLQLLLHLLPILHFILPHHRLHRLHRPQLLSFLLLINPRVLLLLNPRLLLILPFILLVKLFY